MKKILITPRSFNKVSTEAEDYLKREGFLVEKNLTGHVLSEEEMISQIKDSVGLIVGIDPVTRNVLEASPKLRVISKYGTGVDNIDLEYANKKGIEVLTTSTAPVQAVADFTFALLLCIARDILTIDKSCRNLEWHKRVTLGVFGKTIGILGLGNIGKAVAKRAFGFDMKILAYDRSPDKFFCEKYGVKIVSFDEIFSESDFVSIHLPFKPELKWMVSKPQLKLMKSTAVIINTSRGGFINESDLSEVLLSKGIWGAGLDVFEDEPPYNSPLLELPNVVLGTHCSSSTFDTIRNMSLLSAKNLVTHLKGGD